MKINEGMKKTILKVLTAVSIVAVILLLVVFIALKVLTSPERLRENLVTVLSTSLEKEVELGSVKLGLGSFVLSDLSIYAKDQDSKNSITINKLRLKFSVMALLKRRILINNLRIIEPNIKLVDKPKLNWQAISLEKFKLLLLAKGIFFDVTTISVKRGSINCLIPDFVKLISENLNLEINKLSGDKFAVNMDAMINNSELTSLEFSAIYNRSKEMFIIESADLALGGGHLMALGSVSYVLSEPKVDIKYTLSETPTSLFSKHIQFEGRPELSGELKDSNGNLYLTVKADLGSTAFNYKNKYYKKSGEKLDVHLGIIKQASVFNIDWLVLNTPAGLISGTGGFSLPFEIRMNLIGEALSCEYISKSLFKTQYIQKGILALRHKFEYSKDIYNSQTKGTIKDLEISNIKALSELYMTLTRSRKSKFTFQDIDFSLSSNDTKIYLNDFQSRGGDVPLRAKGNYSYSGELNFVLYPRIFGREYGFRIYGDRDDIKYGLK